MPARERSGAYALYDEVVGQGADTVQSRFPLDEHGKDAIEEDFRSRKKK